MMLPCPGSTVGDPRVRCVASGQDGRVGLRGVFGVFGYEMAHQCQAMPTKQLTLTAGHWVRSCREPIHPTDDSRFLLFDLLVYRPRRIEKYISRSLLTVRNLSRYSFSQVIEWYRHEEANLALRSKRSADTVSFFVGYIPKRPGCVRVWDLAGGRIIDGSRSDLGGGYWLPMFNMFNHLLD